MLYSEIFHTCTTARAPLPGKKKKKKNDRVTALLCRIADRGELLPAVLVSSHIRSSCFTSFDPAEAGVDYMANRKAWMNRGTSFDWLDLLDEHFGRKQGRCAVVFGDNASYHGKTVDLQNLRNVDVIYLRLLLQSCWNLMRA